jgi:hypothetical protein
VYHTPEVPGGTHGVVPAPPLPPQELTLVARQFPNPRNVPVPGAASTQTWYEPSEHVFLVPWKIPS